MCRVSELGLGTTRKLHHHGPGSSGRAGEEKHATHARARTADTDRGDAGCCMRSVGRSTGFSHATLRKKTGWSEMPTHFALWCVPYRLPLPLPHIFYLDDIYALLIWLEATFMSWSHIWPMNATVCLPLYLSDLPPFHSISAPPPLSLFPSLPHLFPVPPPSSRTKLFWWNKFRSVSVGRVRPTSAWPLSFSTKHDSKWIE